MFDELRCERLNKQLSLRSPSMNIRVEQETWKMWAAQIIQSSCKSGEMNRRITNLILCNERYLAGPPLEKSPLQYIFDSAQPSWYHLTIQIQPYKRRINEIEKTRKSWTTLVPSSSIHHNFIIGSICAPPFSKHCWQPLPKHCWKMTNDRPRHRSFRSRSARLPYDPCYEKQHHEQKDGDDVW